MPAGTRAHERVRLCRVAGSACLCMQELLEAMVQAGPSVPVASLPVMSEMMRRLDALDSLEAGAPAHPKTCAPFGCPPDPLCWLKQGHRRCLQCVSC